MTNEEIIRKLISSNFKIQEYDYNTCLAYIYFGPTVKQSNKYNMNASLKELLDDLYLQVTGIAYEK